MDSEDFRIKIKIKLSKDFAVAVTADEPALLSWVQLQQLVFKVTKSSLILD